MCVQIEEKGGIFVFSVVETVLPDEMGWSGVERHEAVGVRQEKGWTGRAWENSRYTIEGGEFAFFPKLSVRSCVDFFKSHGYLFSCFCLRFFVSFYVSCWSRRLVRWTSALLYYPFTFVVARLPCPLKLCSVSYFSKRVLDNT